MLEVILTIVLAGIVGYSYLLVCEWTIKIFHGKDWAIKLLLTFYLVLLVGVYFWVIPKITRNFINLLY